MTCRLKIQNRKAVFKIKFNQTIENLLLIYLFDFCYGALDFSFDVLVSGEYEQRGPEHRRLGKHGRQGGSHWRNTVWVEECVNDNDRVWSPRSQEDN